MKQALQIPSRGKCRLLWTQGLYAEIAKNYESNPIYRDIFIKGSRRMDLNSIYYTSLLHLGREEDILKAKSEIIKLKDFGILPFFLELNKFAIDILHIPPNSTMSKAYDAIHNLTSFKPIDTFWANHCNNTKIAIVGNAPFENKKGEFIDKSDVVFRFNNFKISGFENFIGSKTDVWCHICDICPTGNSTDIYDSVNIDILTDNPLNVPIGKYFLESITKTKKEFYYIPQELTIRLSNTLNAIPSSGIRLLMSLCKYRETCNIHYSIFGFSFTKSNYNKNLFDHYFEIKKETKERAHNIQNEVDLLKKAFNSHQS